MPNLMVKINLKLCKPGWRVSNQAIGHIMTPEVVVARTPPLLSKYLQKYVIKKPNQNTLLSTGDPIHCVVTSQTKYSGPLNKFKS